MSWEVELLAHASHNFPPDIPLPVSLPWLIITYKITFSPCVNLCSTWSVHYEPCRFIKVFFFCIMNHVLLFICDARHCTFIAVKENLFNLKWFCCTKVIHTTTWSVIIPVAISYRFEVMLLYHFYPIYSLIYQWNMYFLLFKFAFQKHLSYILQMQTSHCEYKLN